MFYNLFIKRFIDIFCSSIAILLLSPLLIPIVIGLLFTGEHYVFYFQERIGYKNKPFLIYKFATMLKNSPNMGTGLHTKKSDSRVLPFGHFLRKSKINFVYYTDMKNKLSKKVLRMSIRERFEYLNKKKNYEFNKKND